MTLDTYLKHRRRYEAAMLFLMTTLFGLVNATSKIIENVRAGQASDWSAALAAELTGTWAILPLFPLLVWFVDRLNLKWSNVQWRILWHVPAFVCFSLAHVALFVVMRKLLWALAGSSYNFGPVMLGLLYEMRKGFLVYVCLVLAIYGYHFILDRLQGEAGFVDTESDSDYASTYQHQFLVKMLDKAYLVRSDNIDWIQSAGNYVLLHCAGRSYPMRQTLSGLLTQLDPRLFLRVHRTAIVNLDRVVALQESGDLQLELNSGATVPVSKTHLADLKQRLQTDPGPKFRP